MRVRVITQCDEPGTGPNPRALFTGQSYEVADAAGEELVAKGLVERIDRPAPVAEVEAEPVEVEKPRRRRSKGG